MREHRLPVLRERRDLAQKRRVGDVVSRVRIDELHEPVVGVDVRDTEERVCGARRREVEARIVVGDDRCIAGERSEAFCPEHEVRDELKRAVDTDRREVFGDRRHFQRLRDADQVGVARPRAAVENPGELRRTGPHGNVVEHVGHRVRDARQPLFGREYGVHPEADQTVFVQMIARQLEKLARVEVHDTRGVQLGRVEADHVEFLVGREQVIASVVDHQLHARVIEYVEVGRREEWRGVDHSR